jgi:hypothetical protein
MSFPRAVTGNRMTSRKSNTDMTEELAITDISAITETYQMKRLQNVQSMSRNTCLLIQKIRV